MTKREQAAQNRLESVYQKAPVIPIQRDDNFVIFSDFHLGGRKSRDDFKPNAPLFMAALKKWYRPRGYTMILNGDIEELQRVSYSRIRRRWDDLYQLFQEIKRENGLYKIVGNHDIQLQELFNPKTLREDPTEINAQLEEGLRLQYQGRDIFVFHGHQPGRRDTSPRLRQLTAWSLKIFAHPLGIKNFTRSHSNQKILKTEKGVYDFSRAKGIVSIIGHTHRPLFESLSEIDFHRFQIESLIREYSSVTEDQQALIRRRIQEHKAELSRLYQGNSDFSLRGSIYNPMTLPCLFNSGCVIGRKGLTSIEIQGGRIKLVYWYDSRNSRQNYQYEGLAPEPLPGTPWERLVMKQDDIEYIFSRIDLLK